MPIFYTATTSGDCSNTNSGQIDLYSLYSSNVSFIEPFTGVTLDVTWTNPSLGTDYGSGSGFTSSRMSLSGGVYNITISANTLPPLENDIQILVSSGVCTNGMDVQHTSCNLNNGSLTAYSQSACVDQTDYVLRKFDGTFVQSASTNLGYNIFSNLSPGLYYTEIFDCGGCSAVTETCVINSSTEVDFSLYVVDVPACGQNLGKIYVTEQVGTPPFYYQFSPSFTTQLDDFKTGLTAGTYQVIVTDSNGCSQTKFANVGSASTLTIVGFGVTPPTCLSNNGIVNVIITGGTGPYYYSGTNGQTVVTFSQSCTFTGIGIGAFACLVTDAGFCTTTSATTMNTPNSLGFVSVVSNNSTCSNTDGSVLVNVLGTSGSYTYELSSTTSFSSVTTSSTSQVFSNLGSGTYQLTVIGGSCTYTDTVTISNTSLFNLSYSLLNTLCGYDNGSATILVDTQGSYSYELSGSSGVFTTPYFNTTAYTFNSLPAGPYIAKVNKQNTNCTQSIGFVIQPSQPLNAILNKQNCINGINGSITALISGGIPPYTLNWSPNVGSQTGITVTGLTAGTYYVFVYDSQGCVVELETDITCSEQLVTYQTFNFCEGTFLELPASELGFTQMLNEGFKDLTSGETGCILNSAQFIVNVQVGTSAFTENLYTTTSLIDVPPVSAYVQTIENILSGVTGFGLIEINEENNSIKLNTDCEYTLEDKNISIDVQIIYDIECPKNNLCLSFDTMFFDYSFPFFVSGSSMGKYVYVANANDSLLQAWFVMIWNGFIWEMYLDDGMTQTLVATLNDDVEIPFGNWVNEPGYSLNATTSDNNCTGVCLTVDDGVSPYNVELSQLDSIVDGKLQYIGVGPSDTFVFAYNSGTTQWDLFDTGFFTPPVLIGSINGNIQYPVGPIVSYNSNTYSVFLGSCPLP